MKNNLSIILKYIKKHIILLVISLIITLVFTISSILIPYFSGVMINHIKLLIENNNYNEEIKNILFYLNISLGLIGISSIFQYLFEIIVNNFVEKIVVDLRNQIFIKLNNISLSYIDNISHGDLLNRCINDADNIGIMVVSSLKQFYQGIIMIIASLIIMGIINWILMIVVLVLTPLGFFLSYFIAKKTNKYFKKQTKQVANLSSIVLEDISSLELIHSYNLEEYTYKKFENQNNILYKCGQKAQFFGSLTNPITRLINNFTYVVVGVSAVLLCIFIKEPHIFLGAMCDVGIIFTFLSYSNQFAKPFNEISSSIPEIQQGYFSLKRINDILNLNDDVDIGNLLLNEEVNSIIFDNLSFSYLKDKPLIENFSLTINKGEKVALVGPTGCGKTTIINLLMRFYDPNDGSINFNNDPSFKIKKKEIRKKIGMVLQDTWIFNGTVLENIKYSKKDATFEEVVEASKLANCYDFILRLPKGFDSLIDDDCGLSIGEKQLISIARVMLANKEIMILDEATSNIDTRSEKKIVDGFKKLMKGKTSFMIAHRLSTIVTSDKIIVMDKGKIIEIGTHKELLNKKGFYYSLYKSQFEN